MLLIVSKVIVQFDSSFFSRMAVAQNSISSIPGKSPSSMNESIFYTPSPSPTFVQRRAGFGPLESPIIQNSAFTPVSNNNSQHAPGTSRGTNPGSESGIEMMHSTPITPGMLVGNPLMAYSPYFISNQTNGIYGPGSGLSQGMPAFPQNVNPMFFLNHNTGRHILK